MTVRSSSSASTTSICIYSLCPGLSSASARCERWPRCFRGIKGSCLGDGGAVDDLVDDFGAASDGEAEQGGQQGQAAEPECDQRGDVSDLRDLPPAERVQQHGPQGLALEYGGDFAGQPGVV